MNLKNICEVPSMFRCLFCAYRVTFRRNINEPLLVVILETQKKNSIAPKHLYPAEEDRKHPRAVRCKEGKKRMATKI